MNLYAYVQNDPVNLVDPWGLAPTDFGVFGPVTVGGQNVNPAAGVPNAVNNAQIPTPSLPSTPNVSGAGAWDLIAAGSGIVSANAPLVAAGLEMGPIGIIPTTVGLTGMGFGYWTIWQGLQQIELDGKCEE